MFWIVGIDGLSFFVLLHAGSIPSSSSTIGCQSSCQSNSFVLRKLDFMLNSHTIIVCSVFQNLLCQYIHPFSYTSRSVHPVLRYHLHESISRAFRLVMALFTCCPQFCVIYIDTFKCLRIFRVFFIIWRRLAVLLNWPVVLLLELFFQSRRL